MFRKVTRFKTIFYEGYMIKFQNILAPTDFSEGFDLALNYAKELALKTVATLHIVNVVQPVSYPIGMDLAHESFAEFEKDMVGNAKTKLAAVADALSKEGYQCKTDIIFGRASESIVDYAKDNDIDLICISTHGSSGFEHFLFGSTTEKVLRKAPCPVMVVRFNEES